MNFEEEEKKALHRAASWMKKLKEETLMPSARHAYHAKLNKIKREEMEERLGLSSGQQDQQWIDKANAIKQKISKTKVHSHKTPP